MATNELAKAATITASQLGLSGTLQVTDLDASIASYSIKDDAIIVYGSANGTTSMKVTAGSKSVVANVEVTDAGVAITGPVQTETTSQPTLIHAEDANIWAFRIPISCSTSSFNG